MSDENDSETRVLKFLQMCGGIKIGAFSNPAEMEMALGLHLSAAETLGTNNVLEIQLAIWGLIGRRLAWINMASYASGLWRVELTERGRLLALDQDVSPEDPTGYMGQLMGSAPQTSDVVQFYLRESLEAYIAGLYLSSTVMLGVAAEASMLEAAADYVGWAGKRADKLREHLENPRTFYVAKLQEFQKRLAVDKVQFPPELGDALELDITSVLQLIRLTRNEAGHPTGKKISREDCYRRLSIYASVHKKLHALREFFARN